MINTVFLIITLMAIIVTVVHTLRKEHKTRNKLAAIKESTSIIETLANEILETDSPLIEAENNSDHVPEFDKPISNKSEWLEKNLLKVAEKKQKYLVEIINTSNESLIDCFESLSYHEIYSEVTRDRDFGKFYCSQKPSTINLFFEKSDTKSLNNEESFKTKTFNRTQYMIPSGSHQLNIMSA